MSISKRQLAVIHKAKHDVGQTEEDYRAMLGSFGVASSKDLDWRNFKAVMAFYQRLGFRWEERSRVSSSGSQVKPETRNPKPETRTSARNTQRDKLFRKISAIQLELGLPANYCDGMASQMFAMDRAEWLNNEQLAKLTAALAIYARRVASRQSTGDACVAPTGVAPTGVAPAAAGGQR